MKTDDRCKECKKDWTKCSRCPVMMKWVKEYGAEEKEGNFASFEGDNR